MDIRCERLANLMEVFISGEDRSPVLVREMEREFSQQLDDDERFADLQYALAMFGADGYEMEAQLVRECSWALKTLRGICVFRDCEAAALDGTRFCRLHLPN
jgi:hypothetical protein